MPRQPTGEPEAATICHDCPGEPIGMQQVSAFAVGVIWLTSPTSVEPCTPTACDDLHGFGIDTNHHAASLADIAGPGGILVDRFYVAISMIAREPWRLAPFLQWWLWLAVKNAGAQPTR